MTIDEQVQKALSGSLPTQASPVSSNVQKALSGVPMDKIIPQKTQPVQADKPILKDTLPTNPNTGNADYNGYCQAFVEQETGSGWKGSSAADAWDNYSNQGEAVPGMDGIRRGDLIYFAPDNSNYNEGHVGIYEGNGKFVSATDNGIQDQNVSDWQNMTGQQILGYVRRSK